ncbi:hypothetical protein V498_04094 [Pseudogymnoascus sp. VKM F-4517 (FW-2822)]|nr:hypothetical protein V498_04094 [Pseudogymnoascus sp. VKM F-4517 (FW-2822)]
METDIRVRVQVDLRGNNEFSVNGRDSPVQYRDQDLKRGAPQGQTVLDGKEAVREGNVGQETKTKGDGRQKEADNCQILVVPAIGLVHLRWKVDHVPEGSRKRAETQPVYEK